SSWRTLLTRSFCNDPAPPAIYTLSLHDALPIFWDLVWNQRSDEAIRGETMREVFETLARMRDYTDEGNIGRAWNLSSNMVSTGRSEEHTSELQSRENLVCRLLLEKKKTKLKTTH